jgi:uncharacterized protein YqkB
MSNWIYSKEQLRVMSDAELRELVAVTPLKDKYKEKERNYRNSEREVLLSSLEKTRREVAYKNALNEFKRVSVNEDGSKIKMNAEIRACKEEKEHLYRLFKEEKEHMKFLELEFGLRRLEKHEAEYYYQQSMENFVELLLIGRVRIRIQIERERHEIERVEEGRLSSVNETVKHLTRKELEASMEDVCIICMDTHSIKDTVLTCCGHRFGTDCLRRWHTQRTRMNMCMNCPMCKNEKGLSVTKYEEVEVIDLVC